MTDERLKLDQVEDYAAMRLDVSIGEIAALLGCSADAAARVGRTLVREGRFVRRGDCYAVAPLHMTRSARYVA